MKLLRVVDLLHIPSRIRRRPVSRPARRANARLAVLLGLVLFFAANIGLSLVVEYSRPQWRDPEYFHRQKNLATLSRWNANSPAPRPLVVVLGSSRPQLGFSPDHAALGYGADPPYLFNCSQSGCQPLGQLMNLGRMLDANIVPDYLLVELLPAALNEQRPLDDQIPESRFSRADLARVSTYFETPNEVRTRWLLSKFTAWHSLRFDLLAHAKMADWSSPRVRQEFLWAEMRPNGWLPFYPGSWPESTREAQLARTRRNFTRTFQEFAVAPRVAAAQRKLLQTCRDKRIPVALFMMPESPAFRSLYSPRTHERIREYLHSLSSEFDVKVFDARSWIDDEAAFSDGYHLLGPGAEQFSRRFGADCLRSLLAKPE